MFCFVAKVCVGFTHHTAHRRPRLGFGSRHFALFVMLMIMVLVCVYC